MGRTKTNEMRSWLLTLQVCKSVEVLVAEANEHWMFLLHPIQHFSFVLLHTSSKSGAYEKHSPPPPNTLLKCTTVVIVTWLQAAQCPARIAPGFIFTRPYFIWSVDEAIGSPLKKVKVVWD